MKYFAFIVIFAALLVTLCCEDVKAAPFTVDFPNSALHFAGSGAFGFVGGLIGKCEQPRHGLSDTTIVLVAGTLAQIPGLYKEFVMDAYHDNGDLFFNLGGYVGAWVGVKTGHYILVSKDQGATVVSYAVRW